MSFHLPIILLLLFLTGCLSPPPSSCIEQWSCTQWNMCQNGSQIRTCYDQSNCGTTLNQPPTTKTCEGPAQPFCGDGFCNGSEACGTCTLDCGSCPVETSCGNENGVCDAGETTLSCTQECPLNIAPKELWMHPNKWDDSWVGNESQWDTVVNSLDVFGVFFAQVNNSSTFSKSLLKEKNIRVNVEVGGLRPFQCDGTAFFETIDKPVYDKLVAGGHDDFVASMDAPFTYTANDGFHAQCAQLFANGNMDKFSASGCDPYTTMSCNLSVSQVVDEVVEYLALFHENYPNAQIGWIEPLPLLRFANYTSDSSPAGKPYPDFKQIVDTLTQKINAHNAVHEKDIVLRFFHSDWYFTGMIVPTIQKTYDAWDKHLAISDYLRQKGFRFGILMNDYREQLPSQDLKNKTFYEGVLNYYDCWHTKGGTFDDVVVESWVGDHPSNGVPEEQKYTFTNVMYQLIERLDNPNFNPTCNEQKIIDEIINMPMGGTTDEGDR